jgi:IMP dehydrogenase
MSALLTPSRPCLGTSYCFDDVLMEPLYSDIQSRSQVSLETNIAANGRSLILKNPLISSPMDTVSETQMAIKMALAGGLGIIHRFMPIEEQVSQVIKVKRFLQYIITEPYTISPDASLPEVDALIQQYGVSTFCVVSGNKEFLGILTRRDIEAMRATRTNCISKCQSDSSVPDPSVPNPSVPDPSVSEYMTRYESSNSSQERGLEKDLEKDLLFEAIYTTSSKLASHYDEILNQAKEQMIKNRYEKIPILEAQSHRLLGLVTLKNIRHWENNKSKACIDANGALCVGAAVGITGDAEARLDALVAAQVDLICVDVANGYNEHVANAIRRIRGRYPSLVIMAGNVCNAEGFEFLADPGLDVDCIRVGIGNGSICTTRLETGIGKGQFSAVLECFQTKITSNLPLRAHIICDGGSLGKTGNKVKALAAGAAAVMLGRTLASTEESPGQIIFRNGKRFKYIRGMASTMASLSNQEKSKKFKVDLSNMTSEGVDGEQELTGSVIDLLEQIKGGLRSGLSYLGAHSIQQLHEKAKQNKIKFNLGTSIGMAETGIRVKTY